MAWRTCPSKTVPTVVPPRAATASSTSAALIPYRASWSRRTETRSIGSRPEVGVLMSSAPGMPRQHPLDLARLLAEHVEVGAVEQDGHVALDPRHQLVDPHLDRLAEAELDPRDVLGERLVHLLDQVVAGQARPPLVLRLEQGPDVGLVDPHHVVGDLGPAGLAVDRPDLGEALEDLLDLGGRRHRPLERGRGDAHGLDQQVALVEPGHELAPQVQRDRHADGHQRDRQQQRDHGAADGGVEHRPVEPLEHPDRPDLVLLGVGSSTGAPARPARASASATAPSSRPGRRSPSGPSAGTASPRSPAGPGSAGRRSR